MSTNEVISLEVESALQETINYICERKNITEDVIFSKTQKRDVVFIRQLLMYILYVHAELTQGVAGARIANKDHSTCLHAITTINNKCEIYKSTRAFKEEVEKFFINALETAINTCKFQLIENRINDIINDINSLEDLEERKYLINKLKKNIKCQYRINQK